MTRRLTLNLGVRLDFNYPVREKWNRMNGPFDPNVTTKVDSPNGPLTLKGGLTFAGVNGIPATPAALRKNNWQPRAGAAYQLSGKLVMRGGVGLYYSNFNNDFFQTAGFSTNTDLVNSLDDRRTFIPNVLSNPFPNGIQRPTGSSLGALTFVGNNNNWFDSNYKLPKVWSFSFGFQYQVSQASTLDVSYVGSRSLDQTMEKDYNIPSLDFRKQCNLLEGGSPTYCDAPVPESLQGHRGIQGSDLLHR